MMLHAETRALDRGSVDALAKVRGSPFSAACGLMGHG
jgi:hypothetical protein